MDYEIELISDGDGLAVIGEPKAVERFIGTAGLSNLSSERLGTTFAAVASAAQAGAEIASNSGRWVKLTKESAQNLQKYGLTPTKTQGVSHAMLGQRGSIKKWLQIETAGAKLTSPAILSGAAGIMAQMAMQQTMDEIMDYLANPRQSPAVVRSSNHVTAEVHELREVLGIESGRESAEARRWKEAAAERWDTARAAGGHGIDSVKQFGSETRGQARSAKDKLSERIAERKLRRRGDDQ